MSVLDAMRGVDVGEWLGEHRGRLVRWAGGALAAALLAAAAWWWCMATCGASPTSMRSATATG